MKRGGAIATITLNRPEARNAIDLAMRHELVAALDRSAPAPTSSCAATSCWLPTARNSVELFNKIGLVPDGGGTWQLSRLVGLARAKELIFTGDVLDASEAARIELVNRVVPAAELPAVTRALADKLAAGPPGVLRLAEHMLNRAATSDLASALDLEAYSQGLPLSPTTTTKGWRRLRLAHADGHRAIALAG